jgi:hypothetical protein
MSFNINLNIQNLLLNCSCFRKTLDNEITMEILDEEQEHPFPLEINKAFYLMLDKTGICIHATESYMFRLKPKDIEGKHLEDIFPKYISDFYRDIHDKVLSSKLEIKYRVKINNTYHEIVALPLFSHIQDEIGVAIFKVPYSKVQKPKKKEETNNSVQYVIDKEGNLVNIITKPTWNKFLFKNTPDRTFSAENSPGKNLFRDVIHGESVRKVYRELFDIILYENIKQRSVTFGWFCDGSTIERQMTMNIEKIGGDKLRITSSLNKETVVYHKAEYLDFPVPEGFMDKHAFAVCSFCKRIRVGLNNEDVKKLADEEMVSKKETSINLPGTDIVNIGKKAKAGYSLSTISQDSTETLNENLLKAWIIPRQWTSIKNRYGQSYIRHDVCEICKEEWNDYFNRIRN